MRPDHSQLNDWAMVHTALLVEGQSRLGELVGTTSPSWEMDLATGLLTLEGHRLQFALLGGVDEAENTWRWAWADPELDPSAIAIGRTAPLRRFGQESGLWEFTEETFSVEGIVDLGMTPGASLASVASPQIMGGAIFTGLTPGRRFYAVVTDPRLTLEAPSAFTAPQFISGALAYGLGRPRDIVLVYALAHQLGIERLDQALVLTFGDGTRLEVGFDPDGRLQAMREIPSQG